MSLRLAILASGSAANSFYIESETTAILIDAGLVAKHVAMRVEAVGGSMRKVQAVCVSHGHGDHSNGLPSLVSGYRLPIYSSRGTYEELMNMPGLGLKNKFPECRFIDSAKPVVKIGDLQVTTFPVPHDSDEPVGFYVQNGSGHGVTIATDLGYVGSEAEYWIKHAGTVFLESNYDADMLNACEYHDAQKTRIDRWHLSNEQAAEVVANLGDKTVVLGHISGTSNAWELVAAMHRENPRVAVARPGHTHIAMAN